MVLRYDEPPVLEMSMSTFPSRLYSFLFAIEDHRQAIEIAQRILTKEKLTGILQVRHPPLKSLVLKTVLVETKDSVI